jgi:hypothetical protein
VDLKSLQKQIEMLRLRRQASRIALRLFEAATNQDEIDAITVLFDCCNYAHEADEILGAMEELKKMATERNIDLDL